jgi:hypothetical protein
VPSYEVESLFEPFHRLHDDRTGGDRGSRPVDRALDRARPRR